MRKIFLFILLVGSGQLYAQTGYTLKVRGEAQTPLQLSLQELKALPHVTAVLHDKDGKPYTYSGVPVVTVLEKAGVTVGKALKGESLAKYVMVKCADGYEVLFSLAEMDSSLTGRVLILADQVEGKPLAAAKGPVRLVVPGEKRPARSCFQVVEMIIGLGKE